MFDGIIEKIHALVMRTVGGALWYRTSIKLYYCDKNPKHYYDSNEVKKLTQVPGGWRCSQGDDGVVRRG